MIPGQTVQLLYSPDGNFALDGQQVPLLQVNFSAVTQVPSLPGDNTPQYEGLNELQLFPASPLGPGDYEVVLVGQSVDGSTALADLAGNALGADAANPQGQDITIPFQVDGVEGRAGVDAAGRHRVHRPATGQPDLRRGSCRSPARSATTRSAADTSYIPGNQVDLYHFTVTGGERVARGRGLRRPHRLAARPRRQPVPPRPRRQRSQFVAGNNNSYNATTTDRRAAAPLHTDSALYASLTPGDYYVAVAGGSNTPSPLEGQIPGSFGVYDPNMPGSAQTRLEHGPLRPESARPAGPRSPACRLDQPEPPGRRSPRPRRKWPSRSTSR